MVQDADAIGEPRELVEVVRRDEDDAVRAAQRRDDVAEALRPHGIEPVRRLVEHHHLLLAQQRLREAEPLQVSLRELLDALRAMLVQPELDEVLDHARTKPRALDSGQQRVAPQRFVRAPPWRNVHELGQVADAVLLDEPSRLQPRDAHRPLGRPEEAEQQRDQRRLSRAIRAREPEHLTRAQLEGEIVERAHLAAGEAAIPLPDVVERDHGATEEVSAEAALPTEERPACRAALPVAHRSARQAAARTRSMRPDRRA